MLGTGQDKYYCSPHAAEEERTRLMAWVRDQNSKQVDAAWEKNQLRTEY